jgi:hypothetical protein
LECQAQNYHWIADDIIDEKNSTIVERSQCAIQTGIDRDASFATLTP